MPNCPKCGNKEVAPSRTFSVIVEPARGEKGLIERRVGMYTCSKCNTKFPTVIGRQKYLVVPEEQLKSIQEELTAVKEGNLELQAKIQAMAKEQDDLQRTLERNRNDSEVKQLESKLNELQSFVEHLRKEKSELEEKASRLR